MQKYLQKYCAVLTKEFPFANELNSMARQASAERAWIAIFRFYENCRQGVTGKKGFPKFQKNCRSVEYKTAGWKLADDRKSITFTDKITDKITDKKGIGRLKLKGNSGSVFLLNFYQLDQIKRVRLVKRADGYYVQFCVRVDRTEDVQPSGQAIGLDVGLSDFYTDSFGVTVENPHFLRKGAFFVKEKGDSIRLKGESLGVLRSNIRGLT